MKQKSKVITGVIIFQYSISQHRKTKVTILFAPDKSKWGITVPRVCPIKSCIISGWLPAIISSTVLILSSTCWMRPTSVLVCRLRTLLRRMAVNMLQISAWHVTSQWESSSTMQPMLSASWMMKFISRSNSPPTNWRKERKRRMRGMVWEQGQLSNVKKGGKVGQLEGERRKKKEWFSAAFDLLSVGELALTSDGCSSC